MAQDAQKRGKSYRLTAGQVTFIKELADNGFFGTNDSEVVRSLLDMAIKELVDSDYIKRHEGNVEFLRKRKQQTSGN